MTPRSTQRDIELNAERRRMALMALLACAWLLGGALIGATEALGYLAPVLVLFGLLVLGRYPGEQLFLRRLPRRARATRPRRGRPGPRLAFRRPLPRGGALLAAGLAGRAPPLPAG